MKATAYADQKLMSNSGPSYNRLRVIYNEWKYQQTQTLKH